MLESDEVGEAEKESNLCGAYPTLRRHRWEEGCKGRDVCCVPFGDLLKTKLVSDPFEVPSRQRLQSNGTLRLRRGAGSSGGVVGHVWADWGPGRSRTRDSSQHARLLAWNGTKTGQGRFLFVSWDFFDEGLGIVGDRLNIILVLVIEAKTPSRSIVGSWSRSLAL